MAVFILEEPRRGIVLDYEALTRDFGKVCTLLTRDQRRPSIWATGDFINCIDRLLTERGFNPERDVFYVVGGVHAIVLAVVAIIRIVNAHGGKTARFLFYDSTDGALCERVIDVADASETNMRREAAGA